MSNIIIRKPYDPVERTPCSNELPSLTEQHYKHSCDLGKIIAQHMQTSGQIPPAPQNAYVDCTKLELTRELLEQATAQGLTLEQLYSTVLQELHNEQNLNPDPNPSAINSTEEIDKPT